eukprot:1152861-Pelagomonas_calceolata.AAC.1
MPFSALSAVPVALESWEAGREGGKRGCSSPGNTELFLTACCCFIGHFMQQRVAPILSYDGAYPNLDEAYPVALDTSSTPQSAVTCRPCKCGYALWLLEGRCMPSQHSACDQEKKIKLELYVTAFLLVTFSPQLSLQEATAVVLTHQLLDSSIHK